MNINKKSIKEDKMIKRATVSNNQEELDIQRGDIVYISSPLYDSNTSVMNHGYAVVCSNNSNNLFSSVLEVVFLSKPKKQKNLPTHFWIMIGDNSYVAHCEQVTSVSRDRIERRRGRLSEAERKMLNHCLMISLGL